MSTKPVVATALGVLIPWGNPFIEEIATQSPNGDDPRCSKCGLRATWNCLGHGADGSVCFDCHKADTKVVKRLRTYRAA